MFDYREHQVKLRETLLSLSDLSKTIRTLHAETTHNDDERFKLKGRLHRRYCEASIHLDLTIKEIDIALYDIWKVDNVTFQGL